MDYKKILEGVVNIINTTEKSDIGFANICTYIGENCPELKESEDEQIRKELISLIKGIYQGSTTDSAKSERDKYVAWLEKQGEQKPVEFKPSFRVGDVIKPKDPVLGEPRIIKEIHPKFGYDTNNGILYFEFEDNWELVEQKPAWSEEEKARIDRIIDVLDWAEDKGRISYSDWEDYVTYVRCLLPQPNTKWYKLDDTIQKKIINYFECQREIEPTRKDILNTWINWLKSLRPQNTWKPSDEQMKALEMAINEQKEEYGFTSLDSLYEQLKAL